MNDLELGFLLGIGAMCVSLLIARPVIRLIELHRAAYPCRCVAEKSVRRDKRGVG